MNKLLKNIQNFVFKYELWEKNSKILIGVSGGPDSICLLNILAKLKTKYNLKLHIAHINYGLRGKDSDLDEKLVLSAGKKLNLEVSILNAKNILKKGNLEASLREIRYDFFEKKRQEIKFDLIAVAHNENDQAETVLMRIIRGTGFLGISAMRPKSGILIRPLLSTSRQEIEKFLKLNKISFRIDKTNKKIDITRNKIRHKLIPFIEKEFNPSLRNNLSQMAGFLAEDYNDLEKYFSAKVKKILKNNEDAIFFSASELEKESNSFQQYFLRQVVKTLLGKLKDINKNNIEEILKIVKSTKNKKQTLVFKGLSVIKNGDIVRVNLK